MVIEEKLQTKIQQTDRKLFALTLQLQRLNNDYQEIKEGLALDSEELKAFAENPANFPADLWEQLQHEKKQMDERLHLELSNVADANKTKEVISERGKVQQHWLFIR